ncbi:MAG: M1 family metallopeptidase [Chitinophagaceae bacterium]
MLILSVTVTSAHAWNDDCPKNPDIDILHYSFSINLFDTTNVIGAKATITFLLKEENINKLRLDLVQKNDSLQRKGMSVIRVESDGKVLDYLHESNTLWINLSSSKANSEQTITIQYEGIPNDGLMIGNNKYGDRCFFSDNWPNKARNWLPTVDHPYDKATSEFSVTAPLKYQVVSNGLKVEESNIGDGMRLTHWKQSVPIACWLYVIGVAEFAMQHVDDFDGKPIQTWVYKQDRVAGFYDFATPTKQVLQFYSDYVGPFAYEKLANIQSYSTGGGMEAASAILYHESSVVGDRNTRWRNVVIHEIAHQWFGNAVTEYDWDDVWLSEGLTTYFTMRFIQHAYGYDEFSEELIKARNTVFKLSKANEDYHIVHDNLSDMNKVTSGLTYQKGAWFTHMLCKYIGEEAFHQGIRDYYQRFLNSNATTADLRMAFERASGKDLKEFFNQWLYQGGNIQLKGTWAYNAKAKMIVIELQQVQPEKYVFNMPLEIGIQSGAEGAEKIEVINLDKRKIKISIPSEKMPKDVVLDPGTKLLAQWNFTRGN